MDYAKTIIQALIDGHKRIMGFAILVHRKL